MDCRDWIFVDSSAFKAVVDVKDQFSEQGAEIWTKLYDNKQCLITSNYILDETFTLVRIKCGIDEVYKLRDMLAENPRFVRVMRVMAKDEAKAWDWFGEDWSRLSFTDCVSFAMMERLGIKRVFGFDAHFQRAGFRLEQ